MYDFPFPSAEMLKKIPPITAEHTNKSINFSKMSVAMLERLEDNLQASGIKPRQGSAGQVLLIQGYPSAEAMKYEKSSTIITKASQNLVWTRCTRLVKSDLLLNVNKHKTINHCPNQMIILFYIR